MHKRLICFVFSLIFILFISVPFNSNAYVASSNFFSSNFNSSYYNNSGSNRFQPSYDGIYLFQITYKSFYSPDTINSPVKLNSSYFVSGTWNGQNVDELDSKKLCDIDVSGFSQTFSYTDEYNYFVYSMITCLPVKGGDDFTICFKSNNFNVSSDSYTSFFSYIPGGSGCRMVHFEHGNEHPENPLSYTVQSLNQHFALVLNPDSFNGSYTAYVQHSGSINCTSFSGLTSVGNNSNCVDFFTTSYNYSGDISVTLKENIDNYSFSVYEIFTDGTVTPGFNTDVEPVTTTPDDSGGSSSSAEQLEVSNNILDNIKNIISYIANLPQNIADKLGSFFTELKNAFTSAITGLYDNLISGLEYLFKPSDNAFTEIKDTISEKFGFVNQIIDFSESFIKVAFFNDSSAISDSARTSSDSNYTGFGKIYYNGVEYSFFNWELYCNSEIKKYIDGVIIFCSYFFFFRRLLRRLPGIIGGFTNDN